MGQFGDRPTHKEDSMGKTKAGIRVVLREDKRLPQTQKLGEGSGTGSSSQPQKELNFDVGLLNYTFLLSKPLVYYYFATMVLAN